MHITTYKGHPRNRSARISDFPAHTWLAEIHLPLVNDIWWLVRRPNPVVYGCGSCKRQACTCAHLWSCSFIVGTMLQQSGTYNVHIPKTTLNRVNIRWDEMLVRVNGHFITHYKIIGLTCRYSQQLNRAIFPRQAECTCPSSRLVYIILHSAS